MRSVSGKVVSLEHRLPAQYTAVSITPERAAAACCGVGGDGGAATCRTPLRRGRAVRRGRSGTGKR